MATEDLNAEINDAVRATDTEILNEAFQDEPAQTEQVTETQQQEQPANAQARDEQGRFTAKTEQAEQQPKTEQAEADDNAANVPSWRLREVAEAKRAAEARAEAAEKERTELKTRFDMLERQFQQSQQPKQQQETKVDRPDPLLDPDGYDKWMQDRFESRFREQALNTSMGLAHARHGDKFEKAYAALIQQGQAGNRQLINQITSQSNPGEALMKWHSEQEVLREVGNDPASYKQKMLDEALKDPAFLAKAIEAAKSSAGQGRPNNITQLPPSLSRVSGSTAQDTDDGDGSDAAIFASAFR